MQPLAPRAGLASAGNRRHITEGEILMAKATAPKANANRVTFAFLNETKGALRFEEVGTDGKPVPMDKAVVGSLYFRKTRFGEVSASWASEGKPPALIVLTIEAA